MDYRIGTNVIITGTSGNGTDEFSRAVELGRSNSASFDVWLKTRSSGSTGTVDVSLQGSNDLQSWTEITSTGSMTTVPSHTFKDASTTVVPWKYVRLTYNVVSASQHTFVLASKIKTVDAG